MIKKISGIAALSLAVVMSLSATPGGNTNTDVKKKGLSNLVDTEVVRLAEGLNTVKYNSSSSMGENEYKIFDARNPQFKDLFLIADNSLQNSTSISATSKTEISEKYNKKYGLSVNASAGVSIPNIGDVNAELNSNFDMTIDHNLTEVKEEYFEMYHTYKQVKVATVDWLGVENIDDYFNKTFVNNYNSITNLEDAIDLLTRYGTHVFNKYYFGGSLSISLHIASEKSILQEYKNENIELSLSTSIANAANHADSNIEGYSSNIEAQKVNKDSTKSELTINSNGGKYLNAITVDNIFTYNQEFAAETGSGYVYKAWLNSLDDGQSLRIVKTDSAVSLWDLTAHATFSKADTNELLKKAYDTIYYLAYAEKCNEVGKPANYIKAINYKTKNNEEFSFIPESDEIYLPYDTEATFELGDYIKTNPTFADAKFALDKAYDNVEFIEENGKQILKLSPNSRNKQIALNIISNGQTIYTLKITPKGNTYGQGYGTKQQPYIINDINSWNDFVGASKNLSKNLYFRITKDIDLNGKIYEPIGSTANGEAFQGNIDGTGHTIKNFTVVSKDIFKNVGVFGHNKGVIKNLRLDNVKVLNNALLTISGNNESFNGGILTGVNEGKIENVIIKNCYGYFSSKQFENTVANVGIASGLNKGSIGFTTITHCGVKNNSLSAKGNSEARTGAVAGTNMGGLIENVCITNNSLETRSISKDDKAGIAYNKFSTLTLGGVVGYCENSNYKSMIQYVVSYDNNLIKAKDHYGQVAGHSANETIYENIYYQGALKPVDNKDQNGCTSLMEINMDTINNNTMRNNWVDSIDGRPVLIIHE